MRFYFDIEDYEFNDYYGVDFKEEVMNAAVHSVVEGICKGAKDVRSPSFVASQQIEKIIKDSSDEIIQGVIEKVAEKIARKKAITSITPKVSEIAAADEENVAYFEQMIDRAIAKRFGK